MKINTKINPLRIIAAVNIFIIIVSCISFAVFERYKSNINEKAVHNQILELNEEIDSLNEIAEMLTKDLLDNKIEQVESKRLSLTSDLYFYRETPWQILSCVHYEEQRRKFIECPESNMDARGCMQFIDLTWNYYCGDMNRGYIHDDVACADRYIQANYKVKGNYSEALWQYNHSWEYVDDVLSCASNLGFK